MLFHEGGGCLERVVATRRYHPRYILEIGFDTRRGKDGQLSGGRRSLVPEGARNRCIVSITTLCVLRDLVGPERGALHVIQGDV